MQPPFRLRSDREKKRKGEGERERNAFAMRWGWYSFSTPAKRNETGACRRCKCNPPPPQPHLPVIGSTVGLLWLLGCCQCFGLTTLRVRVVSPIYVIALSLVSCSRAIGQQAGEQEMCHWNDIFDLLFDTTTTNNWPGVESEGGRGGCYD